MSAAVSRGADTHFVLEDVEIDEPRPDVILVRMVATGLCHTDVLTASALSTAAGPALLGHEGAGTVEHVGADVEGIAPGDHVVLTYRHCGECALCTRGRPAYCMRSYALNGLDLRPDGGPIVDSDGSAVRSRFFGQSSFAEYAIAYADNVVVVDRALDLGVIAPLGCGFQTGAGAVLNALRPDEESSVVVFGSGSVGFAAILAARTTGARNIVAIDPIASRRELARSLGVVALDSDDDDLVDHIREATGGGATHALDTTGIGHVITAAVASLLPRGDLVVVGLGAPDITVNVRDIMSSGKSVRGCIEGDSVAADFIPCLAGLYADGRFPIDLLTTPYRAQDIATAVADQRAGTVVKPVLLW